MWPEWEGGGGQVDHKVRTMRQSCPRSHLQLGQHISKILLIEPSFSYLDIMLVGVPVVCQCESVRALVTINCVKIDIT